MSAWTKLVISVIIIMTILYCGLVIYVEGVEVALGINLLFTSELLAAAASSVPDIIKLYVMLKVVITTMLYQILIYALLLFIYTLINCNFSLTGEDVHESNILRVTLLVVTVLSFLII